MKLTNSFKLLWDAMKSSRQSMWVSTQVLIVITVVLAVIFWIAESSVQPEEFGFWNSLSWTFTRYIQDPGEIFSVGPATVTGKIVGSLLGIIAIFLFAVPAGIIGGAFNAAIDEEVRKKHLAEMGERLEKAFRRVQDPSTMFKCVPRYISLGTLQAAKNMTQDDVVDAVEYNSTFRLRNLATAEAKGTHTADRLVVEMFPKNCEYGCRIDRKSDITIVCPTGVSEAGVGNFAYYLALIGGFNFISKEVEADVDNPVSFYILPDQNRNPQLEEYLSDLRRFATGKWVIFLISSERQTETSLHFVTAANANTDVKSTVIDTEGFDRLWNVVVGDIPQESGVTSDLNVLRPVGPKNVSVIIGGGKSCNAFTIRISSEMLVWDSRNIQLAKQLAEAMALTLGNSYAENMTEPALLKQSGFGYQNI